LVWVEGKLMRRKLVTVLATVLAVSFTASQALSATVCGVAENTQGNPVSGATIIIKDASGKVLGEATTGSDGSYSVNNLPDANLDLFLTSAIPGAPGGSGVLDLTGRSERVNWQVSDASGAVASQGGPCDDPAGAFTTAEWASVGVLALGVGAGAAAIAWGTSGNHGEHNHKKPMSPTL
jgi:hypothetical protein